MSSLSKTFFLHMSHVSSLKDLKAFELGQKRIYVFAITQPSLLKSTYPKFFSRESAKNYRRCTSQHFRYSNFLYLSTKIRRFASSLSFNVIEMF